MSWCKNKLGECSQGSGRLTCPSNWLLRDRRTWKDLPLNPVPPGSPGRCSGWPPRSLLANRQMVVDSNRVVPTPDMLHVKEKANMLLLSELEVTFKSCFRHWHLKSICRYWFPVSKLGYRCYHYACKLEGTRELGYPDSHVIKPCEKKQRVEGVWLWRRNWRSWRSKRGCLPTVKSKLPSSHVSLSVKWLEALCLSPPSQQWQLRMWAEFKHVNKRYVSKMNN